MLVNKIKGIMREKGFTHANLAKRLNMAPKTLCLKFKKGVFGSDEIEAMVDILEIEDPTPIFFERWVTSKVTKSIN